MNNKLTRGEPWLGVRRRTPTWQIWIGPRLAGIQGDKEGEPANRKATRVLALVVLSCVRQKRQKKIGRMEGGPA